MWFETCKWGFFLLIYSSIICCNRVYFILIVAFMWGYIHIYHKRKYHQHSAIRKSKILEKIPLDPNPNPNPSTTSWEVRHRGFYAGIWRYWCLLLLYADAYGSWVMTCVCIHGLVHGCMSAWWATEEHKMPIKISKLSSDVVSVNKELCLQWNVRTARCICSEIYKLQVELTIGFIESNFMIFVLELSFFLLKASPTQGLLGG